MNKKLQLPFMKENKSLHDYELKNMTKSELLEILIRENNMLKNKYLVNKLKDKGEKIKKLKTQIEEELCRRNEHCVNNNEAAKIEIGNESNWNKTENMKDNSCDKMNIEYHSHIKHLIEKEKKPNLSFKPNRSCVSQKLKEVIPKAHTDVIPEGAKAVSLEESLDLIEKQFSTLKVLDTSMSNKRVRECINDRLQEGKYGTSESEDTDCDYCENEDTDNSDDSDKYVRIVSAGPITDIS